MKKLFLTSAIIALAIYPSYSTTVTGTGTECTEEKLNTDTGPATLQAQWTANTITLEWYNGETKITPSNGTANTCTYDSSITLPTNNPTKEGYTFGGWQVRLVNILAELNTSIDGDSYYSHGLYDNEDVCEGQNPDHYVPYDDCSFEDMADLSLYEWKSGFSYGTIKGLSKCSDTNGNTSGLWTLKKGEYIYHILEGNIQSNISSSLGGNCWCKVTGYDAEDDGSYAPVSSSSWVFIEGFDVDGCRQACARYCSDYTARRSTFRPVIYGISQ